MFDQLCGAQSSGFLQLVVRDRRVRQKRVDAARGVR